MKKTLKKFTAMGLVIGLSVISSLAVYGASWKDSENGWWYLEDNGGFPMSQWKQIDGTWYYFNQSGYMVVGWQNIGGTWYYFEESGAMHTGWLQWDNNWYYLDPNGSMVTGNRNIDGKDYYFNTNGAMGESDNVVEKYQRYVNDVLIPQYGRINSLDVNYGYRNVDYYGFQIIPPSYQGIISTHIEDMDLDGVPELLVFTSQKQERGSALYFDVYKMVNGDIEYYGGGRLADELFIGDSEDFRIFIKDFGDRKVIGASRQGEFFIVADGASYDINLYQCLKTGGVVNLFSLSQEGSDWPDGYDQPWINKIRQQGFNRTANEWIQNPDNFVISQSEPNCRDLITCHAEYNGGSTGNILNATDLSPFRVVGKIVVNQ